MLSTQRIAHVSARKPWITIGLWVIAVIVSFGLIVTMLGDALTTEASLTTEPESREALRLMGERFRNTGPTTATEAVFISSDSLTVDDEQFEEFVLSLAGTLRSNIGDGLENAATYFELL